MTDPFLSIQDLQALAGAVGITLTRVDEKDQRTQLYVWVADQVTGRIVYVGISKGKRADLVRVGNEAGWTKTNLAPTDYVIGFERLIAAHNASCVRFHTAIDLSTTDKAIEETWSKPFPAVDLNPEGLEQFLIRLHVLCGVLIGNAAKAGQWESQLKTYVDKLAETAIMQAGFDDWRRGAGAKPGAAAPPSGALIESP